jgi:hypothetical protein
MLGIFDAYLIILLESFSSRDKREGKRKSSRTWKGFKEV